MIGDCDGYGFEIKALKEKEKTEIEDMLKKVKEKGEFPLEMEYDSGYMKISFKDFQFYEVTDEVYKFIKKNLQESSHSPLDALCNTFYGLVDAEDAEEEEVVL